MFCWNKTSAQCLHIAISHKEYAKDGKRIKQLPWWGVQKKTSMRTYLNTTTTVYWYVERVEMQFQFPDSDFLPLSLERALPVKT
jgi:hypothetical protein